MKTRLSGLWHFYLSRNIFWPTFVITLCCCYIVMKWGLPVLGNLIKLKIIALALTFYFYKQYDHRQLYFYYNLRLTRVALVMFTVIVDFILFALAIYLSHTYVRTWIY